MGRYFLSKVRESGRVSSSKLEERFATEPNILVKNQSNDIKFYNYGVGTTMDKQKNCLNKLIDSFNKASVGSTGVGKVGLDFYRNKNDNVLIRIGCENKKTDYKYLNDYVVISKEELFLTLFTGCVGPSSIDTMLTSFDDYHGETGSSDLSAFVQSLEVNKIIICYTESYGASKAALVILYNICQKINIDCIPIVIKPALFRGVTSYRRDFKNLMGYFDTHKYHIYDEDCLIHRRCDIGAKVSEVDNIVEEELLTIANSIVRC